MMHSKPAKTGNTQRSGYSSVSIVSAGACCQAAKQLNGSKVLAAKAPRLPLADCTTPRQCSCRFEKHSDRRDGEDRRFFKGSERAAWYTNEERRNSDGRRDED